jgi:hypothetical protein
LLSSPQAEVFLIWTSLLKTVGLLAIILLRFYTVYAEHGLRLYQDRVGRIELAFHDPAGNEKDIPCWGQAAISTRSNSCSGRVSYRISVNKFLIAPETYDDPDPRAGSVAFRISFSGAHGHRRHQC